MRFTKLSFLTAAHTQTQTSTHTHRPGAHFSRTAETFSTLCLKNGERKATLMCILASIVSQPMCTSCLVNYIGRIDRQIGFGSSFSTAGPLSGFGLLERWFRAGDLGLELLVAEGHCFSLGLKEALRTPDLVHSRPDVETQMLPYRGKPLCSLSSPHRNHCISHSCDHSSRDDGVGKNYLKFFRSDDPPSPFIDARGHFRSFAGR